MDEKVARGAEDAVAAEIRAELARQRLTQTALASRLQVARPYLARRLNGETSLTVGDVAAIAAALGVKVADLTRTVDG